MRTRVVVLIGISIMVLPLLAVTVPPEVTTPVSPAFEVHVAVAPSTSDPYQLLRRATPDTYTCSATVGAVGTTYIYTSAKVVAAPGQQESVTKKFLDYELKFTVTVNPRNLEAKTIAEISRGGKILNRQSSTISLRRSPASAVPAQ